MPNQAIGLSNYDPETARIQRQQQLAQMLQEQSQQDIPINSYNGIQAPISPFSIIAKALQAYSGKRLADKADTQYADLQSKRQQGLANMLSKQYQVPESSGTIANQPNTQTDVSGITAPTISGVSEARPTTPQEQLANSLQMMGSSNPQAAQMAPQLYKDAQEKQQAAQLLSGLDLSGVPQRVVPIIKAQIANGDVAGAMKTYGDATKPTSVGGNMIVPTATGYDTAYAAKPAAVQEYDYAVQNGFKGSITDYQKSKAQATHITVAAPEALSPPTQIAYLGKDGEEVSTAASWDKKLGKYVDAATGQPIENPKGLRIMGNSTGGGRSAAAMGRGVTAALDAASDIENMAAIHPGGTMGILQNLQNTPLGALTRTVSTQDVQDMRTTMAGLSRAMALLGSGGLAGTNTVMESLDRLQPQEGDSQLTVMRKLGSFRQQAVNGIDAGIASPLLAAPQKKLLETAKKRIESAVPWLPADVQKLRDSGKSNVSMKDVFGAKLGKGAAPYAHLSDEQIKAQLGIP